VTATPSVAAPPIGWAAARRLSYDAGRAAAGPATQVPLADADGRTLARPLTALTDLPAFPTSSVDGWAVRGPGPWRVLGQVLAGTSPAALTGDGTCVEIATGAMVPDGTTTIVRVEDSTVHDGVVNGRPRSAKEWREPGEEAARGEELLPVGTPITPAVLGLAAACGHDLLEVHDAVSAAVLIFGDELLTAGPPVAGRIRDALGPALPAWLRRLGAGDVTSAGPVQDTLDAHVNAIAAARDSGARLICTTGGTMHGPVDHLHPALAELDAEYVVNTVAVRPGFPMLLARLPGGQLVAGLPGNPQSAIVALASLVIPALAGLTGRPFPALARALLAEDIPGRDDYTHLALVRSDADGALRPMRHAGSAMLRGLARSIGFAVIGPGTAGRAGTTAEVVRLPLMDGEVDQ
jgi:molybdopterin molybdotransferase